MRKTRTIPSRSITSTTNWWAKPTFALFLIFVTAVSCRDDNYFIGFPSTEGNFKISYREFVIPTTTFLVDSVITINTGASGETSRLMTGEVQDPSFGKSTATFYTQYFPKTFPTVPQNATLESLTLTLIFDYYYSGSSNSSFMTFNAHELSDSIVNSLGYFNKSELRYSPSIAGTISRVVSPGAFEESIQYNIDNPNSPVSDSLNMDLPGLGARLLAAAKNTDSAFVAEYKNFRKFRRRYPGIVITAPNTDKVVGFNPSHAKSRLTLTYRNDKNEPAKIEYTLSPASGIAGFTNITTDRGGTVLSGIQKYQDVVPSDNQIYIQGGAGLVGKLDFSEVYSFFRTIPTKALSVAELTVSSGELQSHAPLAFYMRAIKPDNRFKLAITTTVDNAYDTLNVADYSLASKHLVNTNSVPRLDMLGDAGTLFTLGRTDNATSSEYKGYLTNFLQRELLLGETETLNQFALIPYSPDFGKSVDGLRFPKEKVVLKIYYTVPAVQE